VLQYPGCQEACRFHHETPQQQQAEPVILTRGEEVLTLTTLPLGAGVVRWPPMSRQNVVYVLMARPAGASSWRQISQVSFRNMQSGQLIRPIGRQLDDRCFAFVVAEPLTGVVEVCNRCIQNAQGVAYMLIVQCSYLFGGRYQQIISKEGVVHCASNRYNFQEKLLILIICVFAILLAG
jgi:hypothetical protein